jgi:hypothetical protein
MDTTRYFQLSSSEFSDIYGCRIDISEKNNIEEIIDVFNINTEDCLKLMGNSGNIEKYNNIKWRFHIHDITIDDIKNTPSDQEFYICDHCKNIK